MLGGSERSPARGAVRCSQPAGGGAEPRLGGWVQGWGGEAGEMIPAWGMQERGRGRDEVGVSAGKRGTGF